MMKARRNRRLTCSGVASVAMSKSFGFTPSSRSRTAPPTTKALKPASCSDEVTRIAFDDTSFGSIPCSAAPEDDGFGRVARWLFFDAEDLADEFFNH